MRIFLFLLVIFFSINGFAFENETTLADPAKEEEAQEIFSKLKCVVCTSQSLAESNADLAIDIRKLVREELKNDRSQQEIINHLVSRYGEQILLKPPLKDYTYVLWFLPFLVLMAGAGIIILYVRKR